MKNPIKMFAVAIGIVAFLAMGSTAFAKTKTATVTADVIIADLVSTVTATAIDFGQISYTNSTNAYAHIDSSSGFSTSVTFSTTDGDPSTGAFSSDATVVTAGSSGSLTITASAAGTISAITFPDITLATGNPGETIALTSMTALSEDPTASALAVGSNVFYLGGSLALTSATVAGTYTGTGTVTVTY